MPKQAGSIVLILGGVGLIYLAATGYLESAWIGLKGGYIGGSDSSDKPVGKDEEPTFRAGDAYGGRALGRGRGGQVSNMPTVDKGVYYPGASGGLMASDSGVW